MKGVLASLKDRYLRIAVFGLIGVVTGASVTYAALNFIAEFHSSSQEEQTLDEISSLKSLKASNPNSLIIPRLGLVAKFEGSLGLKENGEVEVPKNYNLLGWYENGPTPGELGPSVILGHVDSLLGPAVFHPLQKVKAGDEILVDRKDGVTAKFVVTEVEWVNQDHFPTEKVYGDTDEAELRLITCNGNYDKGELRYSHNIIVYAKLSSIER